ncbi:MAG TPA: glycosyl transferase, partial [Roseiflexaceae bacterium]|nr:glycosyl transferase [Roseiflexaceae bacterium]
MIPSTIQRRSRSGMLFVPGMLLRAWAIMLTLAALALALVNLPYAPRTWFDEGSHLHVPKTLVEHGVYADTSATAGGETEYRYHGPTMGVGPTVMLPIALLFRLSEPGLLPGRLLIAAYALLGLAACYALARRMHGPGVALLATTLLLASRTFSYEGYVEYGRQVLGEVPGTAFLLLGALAWVSALKAGERRMTDGGQLAAVEPGSSVIGHRSSVVLSGLGFGLALVTKHQFVLIVPPALALLALLDWRYYRAGSWALRLVPLGLACACFGAWTVLQFLFAGPGSFWENIQTTRQAAGGAIFVFNLRSTLRAGYYLLRPDLYGGLLLPALAYTAWRARQCDARGLAEALFAMLIGLWLVWYVGASLGWPRYAFPAVALGAVVVARALADLVGGLWRTRRAVAVAVGCYTALAVAVPLALTTQLVLTPDDSAQRFATYMDAHVPRSALVATWEQELAVLTDHRYRYPPQQLLDQAVRHQWLGGP